MSHDMYASWATTEIAAIYKNDPGCCYTTPPDAKDLSVVATRESGRSWPISDGVISVEHNKDEYNVALEIKRTNEGLHGTLTAIGQSLAYLNKGFAGSLIVIPDAYDSHSTPGEHVAKVLASVNENVPVGVYTYSDPDPQIASPFRGKLNCVRPLQLDTQQIAAEKLEVGKTKTLWGHVREGSTDLDAFYKYLLTARRLPMDSPPEPTPKLPDELVRAVAKLRPGIDPVKYLSNATGDDFHDVVWRNFWFENILYDENIPIQQQVKGTAPCNDRPSKILQQNGSPKYFFSGRKDSIKNKLTVALVTKKISEDEAWKKYAQNLHFRAHSYREDVDSGLSALGMLEDDGKPTGLGYAFVDACERSGDSNSGKPMALFRSALVQHGGYGVFLHYVYKLSEELFSKKPMHYAILKKAKVSFNGTDYSYWLEDKLANELAVMRTVSKRGGQQRKPFQAEFAVLRKAGLVSGFRVGVGLNIDWPLLQDALEYDLP